MTTSLVPAIYERYWRPALTRVAKGLTGPGMAEEVRIARLLLGLSPGDLVLDVACGPGNFSREFAKAVGEEGLVVGIDASRTMLARGAAELVAAGLPNLALIRGDATALPFGDGTFDAVCCFAALHLFADPFAGLDEMRRVLRPGGRIALMTSVRRKVTRLSHDWTLNWGWCRDISLGLLYIIPLIERVLGEIMFNKGVHAVKPVFCQIF